MNTNLPNLWRQALVWLISCSLFSFGAIGQTKISEPEKPVFLKITAPHAASLLRHTQVVNGMKFLLIQLQNPVDSEVLTLFNKAGIQPLSIQNRQIIEVSVPSGISMTSLQSLPISSISELKATQKISANLKQWLQNLPSQTQKQVAVLPQKSLKENLIRTIWNPEWGQIMEVWSSDRPRLVVQCSSQQLSQLLNQSWVRWAEEADQNLVPYNHVAAANARVGNLQSAWAGSLTGKGVNVAVGDGGMVELHADLETSQENNTAVKLQNFADHQDHVTGTLGGKGLLQQNKKGMAPEARILNQQTSGTISNGFWLRENEQVTLTNNSYGQAFLCERAGLYNATSSFMDDQSVQKPDLLHVVASGNQGASQCNGFPAGFQTIAEGYPVAKNALTVGSVLGKDEFAWFSSMGPVKDGRVKPEIVADGNDLTSTVPTDNYAPKGGTSMATPVVTGTLALLTERFKQLNDNQLPESALLKAIVCNSAEDVGRPGVDFSTGFGRINGRRALQIIENQSYFHGTIGSNGLLQFPISAPDNARNLKIMLSWTDPAANPSDPKALVHDLDIFVRNGAAQIFLPWVLNPDPQNVLQPATRGVDNLNNLEQVTLPVFGGESITVTIKANTLIIDQKFWVVYQWESPELVLTSPSPGENLKSMQTYSFRWDQTAININTLQLESSLDSVQWQVFQTISQPNKLVADFSLPNTSFQKIWYRLKAQTDLGIIYSSEIPCQIGKQLVVTNQVCQSALKMSWTAMADADKYQIFQLDTKKGVWLEKGFTYQPQYWIGNLEPGKRHAFAVKPWFGNQPGFLSDAKIIIPDATTPCPWFDLAISSSDMPLFFRPGTVYAVQGAQIPLTVNLKNTGNQSFTGGNLIIKCQLPDGHIAQKTLLTGLQPGETTPIQFGENLNVANPGQYPLRFWIENSTDPNRGNDSLTLLVRSVANQPLTLPLKLDFENLTSLDQIESQLGINGIPNLDFESFQGARIQSGSTRLPADWGNGSLVLDKARVDGKTGTSYIVFTFNLTGNHCQNELMLFFDLLPFGNLGNGNSLQLRANDNDAWQEVLNFSNSNLIAGQVAAFQAINLAPFLLNQPPGASFQLRFSFSGQRSATMWNPQGYAIDNLMLMIPSRDVVIKRLLSPTSKCVDPIAQKVKLRLFNEKEEPAHQVNIGYSIGQEALVQQLISSIPALDSVDVEFDTPLPASLIGQVNLKVWSMANDDHFPINDTLKNNLVHFSPIIRQFPYYQSFEANDGYWKSYGRKNSWEWGKPSSNLKILDSAANGKKVWATNLSGNYKPDELSFLHSPCFNLSTISGDVQFSFHSKFDTEVNYDYGWLEYSEDGQNWKKLGEKGNGTNWYNHDSEHWNGRQGRWQTVSYKLLQSEIENKNLVQFRFAFQSDLSNQAEGFAIDDIHIEPAIEIGQTMTPDMKFQFQPLQGNWLRLGSGEGRYAEIKNGHLIPSLTFGGKVNEDRIQTFGYQPYLDRNFVIQSNLESQNETLIRLFFTEKDLKNMEAALPVMKSFQGLGIYQYQGLNQDLQPDNNGFPIGKSRFIPASSIVKVPTSGGYYMEFQAQPSGEFYITQSTFDSGETPLPVQLLQFKASRTHAFSPVSITWKTANERNCDRFEVSYSIDGQNYTRFETQKAKGEGQNETTYQALHQAPKTAGIIWYRLSQFDLHSEKPTPFTTILQTSNDVPEKITWVNPFHERIEWMGKVEPQTQVTIRDGLSRVVWSGQLPDNQGFIPTNDWPPGIYTIQIWNSDGQQAKKLLKQ